MQYIVQERQLQAAERAIGGILTEADGLYELAFEQDRPLAVAHAHTLSTHLQTLKAACSLAKKQPCSESCRFLRRS